MEQKKKSKKKKRAAKQDHLSQLMQVVIAALFFTILTIVMIVVTQRLYQFGYDIFGEQPGTGVEIEFEFEVMEGESAMTTAKRLKSKNLISSELIFLLQKMLYDKDIVAGVHDLHSNMTTLEILEELSMPTGSVNDY